MEALKKVPRLGFCRKYGGRVQHNYFGTETQYWNFFVGASLKLNIIKFFQLIKSLKVETFLAILFLCMCESR